MRLRKYGNSVPKSLAFLKRERYSVSMAKLRHITSWLEQALCGDTARTNSLIKLLRGEGLFTSGGRGRGAPDMTDRDFAVAIMAALTTAPPTKAAAAVESALNLKLFHMATDFDDRADFKSRNHENLGVIEYTGKPALPPEFERVPTTLSEALEMWAHFHRENDYQSDHNLDEITLKVGAKAQVRIELFNPDYRADPFGSDGENYKAYGWQFDFEPEGLHYNPFCVKTHTSLSGPALRELAKIAYGGGEDGPSS